MVTNLSKAISKMFSFFFKAPVNSASKLTFSGYPFRLKFRVKSSLIIVKRLQNEL